ncbi:MAG: hypothetical protein KGJ13_02435 [Patescibacteria group bacterium]|nr:hypothetical protein [Patescibacteria group bacterium]
MATAPAFEGISAALDIAGGLADYFASAYSTSIANSQAAMIMTTAQANERRYALMARALEGTQAQDYAASGVKVSGSPIDVLDQTAQIASQNEAQILMAGKEEALGKSNEGAQAAMQGRMALLSGILGGGASLGQGINLATADSGGGTTPASLPSSYAQTGGNSLDLPGGGVSSYGFYGGGFGG